MNVLNAKNLILEELKIAKELWFLIFIFYYLGRRQERIWS